MNEVKIMAVLNPYTGETEDLICNFEIHVDRKGELLDVSLESIVSESGENLMLYLDQDKIPYDLEQEFKGDW